MESIGFIEKRFIWNQNAFMKEERVPPYSLRMPTELRARMEAEADKNSRSLNAEIVHRLEMTLRAQDGQLSPQAEDMTMFSRTAKQEEIAHSEKKKEQDIDKLIQEKLDSALPSFMEKIVKAIKKEK